MKQLTGLDGSFLYMETPTTFGHVNGLAIYDRPDGAFDPYESDRFAGTVSGRGVRAALHASGAVLHVFNCHLGLGARERAFQRNRMVSEAVLLSEELRHPVRVARGCRHR